MNKIFNSLLIVFTFLLYINCVNAQGLPANPWLNNNIPMVSSVNESSNSVAPQKINVVNNSGKFFSSKNNNMLQLNYFKSIKNINRGNISNKTNYIRTKTFYNFYPKKEMNKSNDINDNSQSDLNNDSAIKLPKKISKKKPINLLYYKSLPKTRMNIRYNLLLENILKEKEKEFEKDYKFPSDKVLLSKFTSKNNLTRKNKLKKPVLNEYIREITFSTEQKKNIPIPYKHYLTQTKEIYSNLDKTFSFLKNDIKYDLIHDKEKHYKSEEKIKRLLLKLLLL